MGDHGRMGNSRNERVSLARATIPECDLAARRRLALVLGMLGSEYDGEVLAAARHSVRLSIEIGLSWYELLGVEVPREPEVDRMLSEIRGHLNTLNEWQLDFILTVSSRNSDSLSARQVVKVREIYETTRSKARHSPAV